MESSKKAITETEETRANRKQATREERIRANRIFKFRMLVMIFINICPVFHWMRNHKNIRNFYYYVCLAEYEKVKNRDSEVLDILHLMGRDDDSLALVGNLAEDAAELALAGDIEAVGGLVTQDVLCA